MAPTQEAHTCTAQNGRITARIFSLAPSSANAGSCRAQSSNASAAITAPPPVSTSTPRRPARSSWPAPMAREISAAMAMPMPTWMPMVRNTSGKVNDCAASGSVPSRATNTLSTRLKPSSDSTPSVIGQVCCQIRRDRPAW